MIFLQSGVEWPRSIKSSYQNESSHRKRAFLCLARKAKQAI